MHKRFRSIVATLLCAVGCTPSATQAALTVPAGFTIERIATIDGARELVADAHGRIYVGTNGNDVYALDDAEARQPKAHVFVRMSDAPAAGVAIDGSTLYVGTQFAVYSVAIDGDRAGTPHVLAHVRTSGASRDHVTTSVAYAGNSLFVAVGSSCNACRPELDDTRASIFRLDVHQSQPQLRKVASGARNAIALTVAPDEQTIWAGIAGADDLPLGHPYEMFDPVTAHGAAVNYGWPACYDNREHVRSFSGDCTTMTPARVVFPAYSTPIGAIFYPPSARGPYAFPKRYRGGAFVTLHGSWHGPPQGLGAYVAPRIAFVAMNGNEPARPVDWTNPDAQWSPFVQGFQAGTSAQRIARPTGVAVGNEGSLFFADDQSGGIYRVRPSSSSSVDAFLEPSVSFTMR